jgi:filamentous hemagglutinin family protein
MKLSVVLHGLIAVPVFIGIFPESAVAQVIPDGTTNTPNPGARVPQCRITGGDRIGANLFHSFEAFSIQAGEEVRFDNAPRVQTIITRVTGDTESFINGTLSANGTANVFLLNPNGVIFGPDADLDIGGSFLARWMKTALALRATSKFIPESCEF